MREGEDLKGDNSAYIVNHVCVTWTTVMDIRSDTSHVNEVDVKLEPRLVNKQKTKSKFNIWLSNVKCTKIL